MCEDFVLSFYFPHQLLAVVASLVSLSLALSTGWSLEQRGATTPSPAPPPTPPPTHLQSPGECMLKGHTWQGAGGARKLGQSRAPEPRKWITGGSLKPEGLAWVSNVGLPGSMAPLPYVYMLSRLVDRTTKGARLGFPWQPGRGWEHDF